MTTTNNEPAGIDLAKLEALARAATPGEWKWDDRKQDEDGYVYIPECSYLVGGISLAYQHEGYQADCDFIAAANPATVLALISLARSAAHAAPAADDQVSQVLPPWPEPVSPAADERATVAPWVTDKQIVDALHSLGIDTEMSKYGFPEIQVRGTNVPNIRRLIAMLAASPAPVAAHADDCDHCEGGYVYNANHTQRAPCRECGSTHAQQDAAPAVCPACRGEGVVCNGEVDIAPCIACQTVDDEDDAAPAAAPGKADAANAGGQGKETDLSKRLRTIAAAVKPNDPALVTPKFLIDVAEEIERYYGGMLNWKRTAEAKDAAFVATSAADAKDAERYRWLVANARTGSIGFGDWWINADEPASEWDAAIDAAIAASQKGGA